jgi:hypothetical protein
MADKFVFSNFATSTLSYAISSTDTLLQINVDDVPKFPALVGGAKFPLILTSGDTAEIVYVSALTLTGQATVERGKEGTQAQSWLAGTHVRHSLTASSVIAAAGLRPRGTWSAATSYSAGDLVVQSGIAYVAVVDNLNKHRRHPRSIGNSSINLQELLLQHSIFKAFGAVQSRMLSARQ